MNDITIGSNSLVPKEFQGQRVVTFKDIDTVHQRPEGTARKRFNDNKKHFVEGEDYFVRNSDEAAKEYGVIAPNGLKLITESGYLMLTKSFTDDLSWTVQRELVKTYFKVKHPDQSPSIPKDLPSALRAYADEIEQRKALKAKSAAQEQVIHEMQPKVSYVDRILNNHGLVTITQIAKDYGMTGTAMNKLLHGLQVQYKTCNGQWLLYRKYQSEGYTHSKTHDFTHNDGTPDVTMTTEWTQKGRLFLYNLLKSQKILPLIEQPSSFLKKDA